MRGLYAITDSALHTGEALEHAVSRAIAGGVKAIQYRDKSQDADRRYAEASCWCASVAATAFP